MSKNFKIMITNLTVTKHYYHLNSLTKHGKHCAFVLYMVSFLRDNAD